MYYQKNSLKNLVKKNLAWSLASVGLAVYGINYFTGKPYKEIVSNWGFPTGSVLVIYLGVKNALNEHKQRNSDSGIEFD